MYIILIHNPPKTCNIKPYMGGSFNQSRVYMIAPKEFKKLIGGRRTNGLTPCVLECVCNVRVYEWLGGLN